MRTLLIICTELVAVTHLTMAVIFFIYSRRSVAYLAHAWSTLLICLSNRNLAGCLFPFRTDFPRAFSGKTNLNVPCFSRGRGPRSGEGVSLPSAPGFRGAKSEKSKETAKAPRRLNTARNLTPSPQAALSPCRQGALRNHKFRALPRQPHGKICADQSFHGA